MVRPYTVEQPFRFWCQKILPLVYDDSISYYELLNKVVDYLNKNVDNVNALGYAFNNLQKYVQDYFTNLDVQQEINAKLDEMAEDGTLDELILPLVGDAVSDWLEENVTPTGSAVVVDASLTISGAAADAKVTGDGISDLKSDLDTVKYMGIAKGSGGYYGYIQYTFTVGHTYSVTNKTSGTVNARTQTTGDSTGTAIETIASNIHADESVVFTPTSPAEYARFWFNTSGNVEIVDLSIGLPKAEADIVALSTEIDLIPTLYVKEQNSSLGNKSTTEYITDVAEGLYAWQQSVNLLSDGYLSHKNINASGELYDYETYATYDFFGVKGGRKIICTRKASSTRTTENALWAFYSDKSEGSFISRTTRSTNAVDIPQNAKYARVSIQNDYAIGNYDIMAEYTDGTNISPVYKPYFTPHYQFLQPDFYGKKICAFGDSIAASDDGYRNTVTWIDLVKEYFGASEAYNRGIGTSCVTSTNAQGQARAGYAYVDSDGDAGEVRRVYTTQQSFANYPTEINPCMDTEARANTIPTDTDVVIIIAGTNDIGTTTLEMFESGYRTMLNNIIARVPNAKIYPCTMPFQQTYDLGDTATKAIYEGYRNVIRNVASDYGLPCIDLRKDMFVNARNYQTYMNDRTHYNTSAGRKRIAECVIATLKEYSAL